MRLPITNYRDVSISAVRYCHCSQFCDERCSWQQYQYEQGLLQSILLAKRFATRCFHDWPQTDVPAVKSRSKLLTCTGSLILAKPASTSNGPERR
jgi:hypothetical protein